MREVVKGFTLIEVSIFLAVTGALFVAVTVGVQNSIYQQRYNDTVQNFADFLGNLYSEVANVQSDGNGRHNEAIYGKLVTFGEEESNGVDGADNDKQSIHVYDVVAEATNSWGLVAENDTLGQLKELKANVVLKEDDSYKLAGIIEDYTPKWGARIQKTVSSDGTESYEDFEGALLIVRNPKSGTIQTFALGESEDRVINVKEHLNDSTIKVFEYDSGEKNYLDEFKIRNVDFCINPSGREENRNRINVRLVAGAHDTSGVEIVSFDSEDNKCRSGN